MSEKWRNIKIKDLLKRDNIRNLGLLTVFIIMAAAFWFVMALNDNVQDSLEVKVNIYNVPDTVTFINEPPTTIHVSLRDRGTRLLTNAGFHTPSININFQDYGKNGVFRFTRSDIQAALKATFGSQATMLSVSVDSMRCVYTTLRGRKVPVQIVAQFEPTPGNVVKSLLKIEPSNVIVYSANATLLDTITKVLTQHIVRTGLAETKKFEIPLRHITGARIEPSKVMVEVGIEPLVSKESVVPVTAVNVPAGEEIVIFPSRVGVSYYTPMSRFGDQQSGIRVAVDYSDIKRYNSKKLPVRITYIPNDISEARILTDSVEYSLVK